MFASIRKYKVRRGSAKELTRRVQSSFVPLLQERQGFRRIRFLGPFRGTRGNLSTGLSITSLITIGLPRLKRSRSIVVMCPRK
jgi:hypothetical protein